MAHQVDFAFPFSRPQVDGEHEKGGIDLTGESPKSALHVLGFPDDISPGRFHSSIVPVSFTQGPEQASERKERDREPRVGEAMEGGQQANNSLDVNLLVAGRIAHDQSDAWRRGNGSSVLRGVGAILSAVGCVLFLVCGGGVLQVPCLQSHTFAPAPVVARFASYHRKICPGQRLCSLSI